MDSDLRRNSNIRCKQWRIKLKEINSPKQMANKNINNIVTQVISLTKSGRLLEARTLCEQLCRGNKKNPENWLLFGDINKQLQNYNKAESSYRRALKIKSTYVVAHNRLAMLFHSQGNFSAAASSYKRSLKLNNEQPIIHFNFGGVLQEQGDIDAAKKRYQEAILLKPDYAKAYANIGYILRKQNDLAESEKSYRLAVQYAPEIPDIYCNLGITLLLRGEIIESEENINKALELNPNYADARASLADVYVFKGEFDKANIEYQQALEITPDSVEILCGYANSLSLDGEHDLAEKYAMRVFSIDPGNFDARIFLGTLYILLGRHEEALKFANEALVIDPGNTRAIVILANIEERRGNAAQAYHYIEPVLDKIHDNLEIAITLGLISKYVGCEDEAIDLLEKAIKQKNDIKPGARKRIHFILGETYDRRRSYDLAFKNYSIANNINQTDFNIEKVRLETSHLIRVYDKAFMNRISRSTIRSRRPIFIVGMPRSGTSLVEQIISSHSKVFGAGELNDINSIVYSLHNHLGTTVQYPDHLILLTEEKLDAISKIYLDRLSELSHDAKKVTDKMPGNYKNLGLIELMLPDAHIIHCRRNPLDTCLSCYFQDFHSHHPYIYNLKHLGQVYNEYLRVMKHWKKVLSIPVLEVDYEELVGNQEVISRKMIEFCDLEWEEACLNFHKNKRLTLTASYDQVRKPIYKKSVQRWKNYESHIGELIKEIQSG